MHSKEVSRIISNITTCVCLSVDVCMFVHVCVHCPVCVCGQERSRYLGIRGLTVFFKIILAQLDNMKHQINQSQLGETDKVKCTGAEVVLHSYKFLSKTEFMFWAKL